MKQLLAALLLAPAILLAQDNPNYDPDYNGDGCFSITDVLGLLPLFGSCVEADTTWACGDSAFFDNYWYATTLIGDQCWFAENLRTQHYANGDSIPAGLTDSEWITTTSGATAVYGEGSSFCLHYSPDIDACDEGQSLAEYGRLYNWYAVDDTRGLCPSGWRVPSDEEWTDLEIYITSQSFDGAEGTALKSTYGWFFGGNGTDNFGFSALPGGWRTDIAFGDTGRFDNAGFIGHWWSSSFDGGFALYRNLNFSNPDINWDYQYPNLGFSVRCLSGPIQGCTDSSYLEYNPSAELDNGSCLTLVSPGCTDSLYVEFDPIAIVDDGSCLTLAPTEFSCGDSALYDNYWYATTLIGDQCWFAENLRTATYLNGDSIPEGLTDGDWTSTTSGATTVFGEGNSFCDAVSPVIDACDEAQSLAEYGRLYNWYVVNDARGLCPSGWRVPTDEEWTDLKNYITSQGFNGIEGTALKSTYGWYSGPSSSNGTDDFGFSALPGGSRNGFDGTLGGAGLNGSWWSSSPFGPVGSDAYRRSLNHYHEGVLLYLSNPRNGYSVRCLRDAD